MGASLAFESTSHEGNKELMSVRTNDDVPTSSRTGTPIVRAWHRWCAAAAVASWAASACRAFDRDVYVDVLAIPDACAAGTAPGEGGRGCVEVAFRPIAPLSTATVTTQRPTLRWTLHPADAQTRVEICADRACTRVETTLDATGDHAQPDAPLAPGTHFWRLRARAATAVGPAASPTWQFRVGHADASHESSSGTTFDFNGDGFADLAIGVPRANSSFGAAYIHLGASTGINRAPALMIPGPGTNGELGAGIASAGDVNGDGFPDLVVGAHGAAVTYLHFGGPTVASAAPSQVFSSPTGAGNFFGYVLASAGDVNGDGYADVAVGAPLAGSGTGTGAAYVYYGGPQGVRSTPDATLIGDDVPNRNLGKSFAAADFNGDGYGDLVVGASLYGGAMPPGRAYFYPGSASGIASRPTLMLTGRGGDDRFGFSVAAIDVNGDGYPDLAVGSPPGDGVGEVRVYRGGPSGLSAMPAVITGGAATSQLGVVVLNAGDLDRDGFSDLLVSAGLAQDASPTERVFVFRGSANGLATVPALTLGSGTTNSRYGYGLSAGDMNGDGYIDLAIGDPYAMSVTGQIRIHMASAAGISATPTLTLTPAAGQGGMYGHTLVTDAVRVPWRVAPPYALGPWRDAVQ
jgi:hypothetical protein